MLNITSAPSVSWPTAPGVAVPPVSPVTAVQPVQGSAREPATDPGQDRGRRTDQGNNSPSARGTRQDRAAVEAAPLLPHKPPDTGPGATARAQQDAQASAEQAERAQPRLREVLSSVWQASAAVVERVLGRHDQADSLAVTGVPGTEVPAALLPVPATGGSAGAARAPLAEQSTAVEAGMPAVDTDAVISYDDHGHSNLAPLEPGNLVSERV